MVRKDMYPVCHDYRYTSGDDSEGEAKAHDPNVMRIEYCNKICRVIRTVSSAELTYLTMTARSSSPKAHDPAQLSLS
jgi:hypothetical protein